MKASPKCSLILMRDDGHTRRVRLSQRLLRLLCVLLVLLPFFGVGGLWLGYETWRFQQEWDEERRALTDRLNENKLALERLGNIEALYKRTVGGAIVPSGPEGAASPRPAGAAEKPGDSAAAPPATGSAPQTAAPPGDGGIHEIDNQLIVDTGVVRIENVVPRLVDPRKLRITVDLYNAEPAGQQLSGQVRFYVLTGEGQEWKLNSDDAQFRISRFKKVVATSSLPGTLNDAANAAVKIEVLVSDAVVYRKLYPIESR